MFPNVVLGTTEYSNAVSVCYTFQPLISFGYIKIIVIWEPRIFLLINVAKLFYLVQCECFNKGNVVLAD